MRELQVDFPQPCGENWEAMAASGCNRHCASCDKTIYDLEAHSFEDVEALVAREEPVCVRARIGFDGMVALEPDRRGFGARVVIAAASAGLLATAAPAHATDRGKIVGQIDTSYWGAVVFATDTTGKRYRGGVRGDGRFWIKKLPPGDYVVTATSCGGEAWTVGKVSVAHGETSLPKASEPPEDECIIVGVMERKRHSG